jgi:hypothetical protein
MVVEARLLHMQVLHFAALSLQPACPAVLSGLTCRRRVRPWLSRRPAAAALTLAVKHMIAGQHSAITVRTTLQKTQDASECKRMHQHPGQPATEHCTYILLHSSCTCSVRRCLLPCDCNSNSIISSSSAVMVAGLTCSSSVRPWLSLPPAARRPPAALRSCRCPC